MASEASWHPGLRVTFRFLFCYWILWALPEGGRFTIIPDLPYLSLLTDPYTRVWQWIVPWTGRVVFHITDPHTLSYFVTGSGDTTKNWISLFCYVVLSLAVAIVWTVCDRGRTKAHGTLHAWLRLIVRFLLGFVLLGYGSGKIVPMQFREPGFIYLHLPYGQASPMGALWRFMGSSLPYTIFTGVAEWGSGFLLFFRRTTTLGALGAAGVMLNVAALNYCYDVPVKIYSTNLLFMALFLLAPDAGRLADVVVWQRTAPAADPDRDRIVLPWLKPRWQSAALGAAKAAFLLLMVGESVSEMWTSYQENYANSTPPPLYGTYEVESFIRSGVEIPPLLTDGYRWRRVAFEYPGIVTVWKMDDKFSVLVMNIDERQAMLIIDRRALLRFSKPEAGVLELAGTLSGDPVTMRLRRHDKSDFPLLTRGFHWVQEQPVNH